MRPTDCPIWSVYVVEPLFGRQRKQTVYIYRVGALTKEEAIEIVRARMVNDEFFRPKSRRIVECFQSGTAGAVTLSGVLHKPPEAIPKTSL